MGSVIHNHSSRRVKGSENWLTHILLGRLRWKKCLELQNSCSPLLIGILAKVDLLWDHICWKSVWEPQLEEIFAASFSVVVVSLTGWLMIFRPAVPVSVQTSSILSFIFCQPPLIWASTSWDWRYVLYYQTGNGTLEKLDPFQGCWFLFWGCLYFSLVTSCSSDHCGEGHWNGVFIPSTG